MPRHAVTLFSVFALLLAAGCMKSPPREAEPSYRVSTLPPAEVLRSDRPDHKTAEIGAPRIPGNVPSIKVALLVPLTGESAPLGQAMLDAATLAIYDAFMPLKPEEIRARVILMPRDTGNSPTLAAAATDEVIRQGATLILGPLFSNAVSAAAPVARRQGVPMLTFSNNRAVASENVYLLGFLPEQQVKRVADYAAQKNLSTFGALLPSDAYGAAVADTLKSTLSVRGAQVVALEQSAPAPANLLAASGRLKAAYDQTPFKAMFIADGGSALTNSMAALQKAGMDLRAFRLIGTGLWDDPDVQKRADMPGAWFASSPPQYQRQFERRFLAVYGYRPQRLSSLAYDAAALAAALAQNGQSYTRETLTLPGGFMGPANGLYRLNKDGTSERALSVMEIMPSAVKVLDAAPMEFENSGPPAKTGPL